ncbi:hypothetical protein IEQ34_011879 [Dendrobium chrysotoxum]|uniref:Uncharacterized protein n=1 Tax=Dendrobium chrysotoxum TaxID=161865 RepID=A0AAV7GUY2_DENCH|nr:hypothetical protein IEQ34_011879 [Dendrobium chrysotoxum]
MTASASTTLEEEKTRKGREEKSTEVTVSERTSVPNRTVWARHRSMSSNPRMPSGKPGKFSTSVVVVSCPPAAMSLAIHPSKRTGLSSARAA